MSQIADVSLVAKVVRKSKPPKKTHRAYRIAARKDKKKMRPPPVNAWKKGQSGNPNGRPPGSYSRFGEKQMQELAQRYGITPLEFMLACVRDDEQPMNFRLDAAVAAAPYMHRRMPIAIEGGDANKPITFEVAALVGLSAAEKLTLLSLFEKMALPAPVIEGQLSDKSALEEESTE